MPLERGRFGLTVMSFKRMEGLELHLLLGAFVAMVLALGKLVEKDVLKELPIKDYLAAISVGVLPDGTEILDLEYVEDSIAHVDMNVVMTGKGEFVELQGTGEEATFTRNQLMTMLDLADKGLNEIFKIQEDAIQSYKDMLDIS